MGTAAYMSPEQARGKAVTKASDIWAFGAVLYEMLTSKQAFTGEDITDILSAVMTKEPDFDALPANTPASIRTLLRRCLRKDRHQRLQDATGIRIEIDEALSSPQDSAALAAASAAASQPVRSSKLPWVIAASLALATGGASLLAYRATRPIELAAMHFSDDVGSEISLAGGEGPAVAISPDGSRVAYLARVSGQPVRISVRSLLAGTDGAEGPFFSPDGRWIGFFVGGLLKKIAVEGGAATTICETGGNPRGGGFWAQDGNMYIANQTTPVLRVPANGGKPSPVMPLASGETTNRAAPPRRRIYTL